MGNKEDYMRELEYLPEFMMDFHDQKDLFKAIYDQYHGSHQVLKDVSWVDGHQFTIDIFLWWMGNHGYKLQKIRKQGIDFDNPTETINHFDKIRKRGL